MSEQSPAFMLGFLDAQQRDKNNTRFRYAMLTTITTPTDRELSDYWYGWHQGLSAIRAKKRYRSRRAGDSPSVTPRASMDATQS